MTHNEVVNKLSMEMALALGDLNTLQTCRAYIRMALSIGIEHFEKNMHEIIQLNRLGEEVARYKGLRDAVRKTGIDRRNIHHVLTGQIHSAGGFQFILEKDRELIPIKFLLAKKTA